MSTKVDLNTKVSVNGYLAKAKKAYTTRRVEFNDCWVLIHDAIPKSGDLVFARVEKIGQQKRIELSNGRRARLFVGDEIVVVYGNRYAPDQFEAIVPDTMDTCHLVAAGGVAAQFLTKHDRMKAPTIIKPIGILGDIHRQPLNLSQFSMKKATNGGLRPLTIAVAGTSMNSGKTTTAASLVKGLTSYGMRVGAAKITGTGSGGDIWFMKDSGANPALDFVDAGFPSTYRIPFNQVESILDILTGNLACADVGAIVLEIADGLYQEETARLLSSKKLMEKIDGLIFAAGEALGAKAGVEWLNRLDIPVAALSGTLTRSPLAMREAEKALNIRVLTSDDLSNPVIAEYMHERFPNQNIKKCVNF